jgi:hypothetical protein
VYIVCADVNSKGIALREVSNVHRRIERQIDELEPITQAEGVAGRLREDNENVIRQLGPT